MRAEMEQHAAHAGGCPGSRLMQWPCQIKLLPPQAPFYDGALYLFLLEADCFLNVEGVIPVCFLNCRI